MFLDPKEGSLRLFGGSFGDRGMKRCFQIKCGPLGIYIQHQITSLHETIISLNNNQQAHPRQSVLVHWSPPLQPFRELNTDESSLGNPGTSSFGGVIRDNLGQ